ncbi:MAG TPA: hypothetical protein VHM28_06550 [Anaerolineales bacterium]|nr:hypothetical protein [Anaerolineales bacterium]
MKTAIRTFTLFVLIAIQISAPVSAQAQSQSSSQTMDSGLYHAVLDAAAKDAASFQPGVNGFSLDTPNLNYQLNDRGLSVSAEDQNWSWGLQLDGFGREDQTSSLSAPKFSQGKGRTDLKFSNLLTEWYRNTGIGLEQGFSINENPKGNGKLVLHMSLDSTLNGSLSDDERSLSFDAGDGKSLHYSNLRAFDANGNELDAKIVYTPGQIVIHIDDNGAAYPLTIDPLIYIEQKQLAYSPASGDAFGGSVAIDGDTALVGAAGTVSNMGVAYLFVRSGSTWSLQTAFLASDGAPGDQFGASVVLDGDTALVGAPGKNSSQGAVYVYVKAAGGWTNIYETAVLTASDGAGGDTFGRVALSGDTALIGASNATVLGHTFQGAAYIFVKPASGWTTTNAFTAKLTSSDGAANDSFAYKVDIDGDTAIVGAIGDNSAQGSAYVFVKPATGWETDTETVKLTASDGAPGDQFGSAVAISGNTALIGANGYNSGQGEAYVFVKPSGVGGWSLASAYNAKLLASDGATSDRFGTTVALDGDTAVVGAWHDDISIFTDQGSAYVFIKPAGVWSGTGNETTKLTASDGAGNDNFGDAVALSGDTALIGAFAANSTKGAAYFYYPYRTDQDLAVSAATLSASLVPLDTNTFTTTVSNFGSANADNVVVSAPLPDGFTYVSDSSTKGVYDSSTGSWDVGTLNVGVTATLSIQATVDTSIAGTSPVFTAKTIGSDLNPANNSASVSVHVPLLSFSPSPLAFGNRLVNTSSLAQTVTVTNVSEDVVKVGLLKAPLGFIVSSNLCTNKLLDSYQTCTFKVAFKPTTTTLYKGNITLPSLTPTDTASLPVSGTGAKPLQLLSVRSFEVASVNPIDPTLPAGWSKHSTNWNGDGRECIFAYSGSCAVAFHGDSLFKQLMFTANHSGSAGDKYVFSVYRGAFSVPPIALGTIFDARVYIYNGATPVDTKTITFPVGTYAFTKSSLSFTTSTPYTQLVVMFEFNATSGTIYLDNASLIWNP